MGAHRITEAARLASTYTPEGNAKVMEMVAQLHDGIDLGDERKVIEALFLCGRTGEEITTYLDRVIEEARWMRQARQSIVGFTLAAARDLTATFVLLCAICAACIGHAHAATAHPLPEASWTETVTVICGWWLIFAILIAGIWAVLGITHPRKRLPDDYEDAGA